jgi:preprotein translocase subunit YajC
MKALTILLQAPAEGGSWNFLILLGGMFIIMYFFMIRPQMKKQKEAKNYRESIDKGDKVVTIGGIHGKVLEMHDTTVLIQVETGKLRVEKSAISPSAKTEERELQAKA